MAPGISYDESGSLANYFGVTFLALILVPTAYLTLRPDRKEQLQPLCRCSECRNHAKELAQRRASKRARRTTKRAIPILLAWAFLAYLLYGIYVAPPVIGETPYDPFEVLGITSSSTEKQIKKHYKKLSLQFHPDKVQLAENQTKEDAEGKYVELTKAYKALTDEVTRENLAKYGNPDGPQQREDKIAIPQWVVEGKNNIWILGAYGLVLGVGIPWIVGRWWFSQRRMTRDGILNTTAEGFFHQLRDDTDFVSLIAILASASEIHSLLSKKNGSKKERKDRQAKVEDLEKVIDNRKEELAVSDDVSMKQEHRAEVKTAPARRARALLWSHLLRIELEDVEMKSDLETILLTLQPLLTGLVNISLAHNWLKTSLLCMNLQPSLVQAVPNGISPLAQLPTITAEQATEMAIVQKAEGKKWLNNWYHSEAGAGSEAKQVAKTWPRLEVVSAEFKVTGEKVITPSAIVQLTYKCRYVYPTTSTPKAQLPNGHLKLPNGDHDATKEESTEETVADAVSEVNGDAEKKEVKAKVEAVKEAVIEKKDKLVGQKGKETVDKVQYPANGYAHAPLWPLQRKPHYYVLLGDSKLDKVIVQPSRITDIPLPREDGLASEPREYSMQFQAPPQPNLYSFVAHWRSDTYLGNDVHIPIMLKVEAPEEAQSDDDDDISEPDEDTLAGQMAMMRGGKVKASGVHGDDDDEDDDDGESRSEYESSSDEDGPKRGRAINEDSDSDSD